MAKSSERNKAIIYRQKGKSIKDIAKILGVSKSSVSIWCRDISLTPKQINKLHIKMVRGSYVGRLKGSRMQHEKRIERTVEAEKKALEDIGRLSYRDLLIAIAALYWGEGCKSQRVFFLSNSDPEMVKFILKAYSRIFKISKNRIILSVGLNLIHKKRDDEVKTYWSTVTGIPKVQFRKTIFIKAKNKKNYKNFHTHYGTIRINVEKSIDNYYRIIGLIKGLTKGL